MDDVLNKFEGEAFSSSRMSNATFKNESIKSEFIVRQFRALMKVFLLELQRQRIDRIKAFGSFV